MQIWPMIIYGYTVHTAQQQKQKKHEKMGTLKFYIPGFQNDPIYPKQKEILKFCEENLK